MSLIASIFIRGTPLYWLTTYWLRLAIADNRNQMRWLEDPELTAWLTASRLDVVGQLTGPMPAKPRVREKMIGLVRAAIAAATENVETLLEREQ